MSTSEEMDPTGAVADWWATSISSIAPGSIELRGRPIADLLRERSFTEVMWLLVMGVLPTLQQRRLLEAALIAAVDHGPQAPSIASARMAATCGVGLNSAMANGINVLGDVHGGAGQQCVELLHEVVEAQGAADTPHAAAGQVVARYRETGRYLPGFGHRFHPVDPRRQPVLDLLSQAREEGTIEGRYVAAGLALEHQINRGRARPVPINVDGVTADQRTDPARNPAVLRRSGGGLSGSRLATTTEGPAIMCIAGPSACLRARDGSSGPLS